MLSSVLCVLVQGFRMWNTRAATLFAMWGRRLHGCIPGVCGTADCKGMCVPPDAPAWRLNPAMTVAAQDCIDLKLPRQPRRSSTPPQPVPPPGAQQTENHCPPLTMGMWVTMAASLWHQVSQLYSSSSLKFKEVETLLRAAQGLFQLNMTALFGRRCGETMEYRDEHFEVVLDGVQVR